MTDDLTPDPPDQRDEHIAELLEVPPLDEITRRRLVATALEATALDAHAPPAASAAPRGRRLLAVAAAAVAVVAVGAGVLVVATSDDGGQGTSTVAGRVGTPKEADAGTGAGAAEDRSVASPAPEAAPEVDPRAATLAAPRDLGDLGNVTDSGRLRSVIRGGLSGGGENQTFALASQPCLADASTTGTPPVAVATGRFEQDPVVIVVVPKTLDEIEVTVLDAATCTPRSTLTL